MKFKFRDALLILAFVSACGSGSGSNGNNSGKKDNPTVPQTLPQTPPQTPPGHPRTVVDRIIDHQNLRFEALRQILNKDAKYTLRIPGQSSSKHNLGTGIAKNAWNRTGIAGAHQKVVDHLTLLLAKLEQEFPGRVTYGWIGDFKFDSATGNCNRNIANPSGKPGKPGDNPHIIDVWGANDGNFNFPNGKTGSFGHGQASCFSNQRPGVFGISTMPPSGDAAFNRLKEDDKCLSLY